MVAKSDTTLRTLSSSSSARILGPSINSSNHSYASSSKKKSPASAIMIIRIWAEKKLSKKKIKPNSTKSSFDIFDGTGASSAFAEFIHDGDSDDERADNEQTTHWSAVQDLI